MARCRYVMAALCVSVLASSAMASEWLLRVGERSLGVDEVLAVQASPAALDVDRAVLEAYVERAIQFELFAQEARRLGYDKNRDVIVRTGEFAAQKLSHLEVDDKTPISVVSDQEIDAALREHLGLAPQQTYVRAHHVLVTSKEEALQVIKDVQGGDMVVFRKAVSEHSVDQETKLRGGDLRYFDHKGLPLGKGPAVDLAIAQAAFALKQVGDVTRAPVAVGSMFSVVKLTGKREPTADDSARYRSEMRQQIWQRKRADAWTAYARSLRRATHAKVDAELLQRIYIPPVAAGLGLPAFPPGGRVTK